MSEESTVIEIREGEQSIEIIADQIEKIASAAEELRSSGLTDRGLIVLLHDLTGLGKRDIQRLLDALPQLRYYLGD